MAEQVLLRWLLPQHDHAVLSNVELAVLSNVSVSWRAACQKAILANASVEEEEEAVSVPKDGAGAPKGHPRGPLLLLPSMVRSLVRQQSPQKKEEDGDDNFHEGETFCAAWFPPEGIQGLRERRLLVEEEEVYPVDEEDGDARSSTEHAAEDAEPDSHHRRMPPASSDNTNTNVPSEETGGWFVPSSYESLLNSEHQDAETRSSRNSSAKEQRRRPRSRSPFVRHNRSTASAEDEEARVPTCCEWRGYRTATDVLRHFGYAPRFVRDVLQAARQEWQPHDSHGSNGEDKGSSSVRKMGDSMVPNQSASDEFLAVRGAHLARPESYCLCVEANAERLKALRRCRPTRRDSDGNSNDEYVDIRLQEYKQSLVRQELRRRELQRDVLPRIISRTFVPAAAAAASDFGAATPSSSRCVQFLNAAGSHAVCMMTPPFQCGTLREPVTILCVGIATEDGCFLSGLHHRFELGHLYPNDEIAQATELSPVCLATELNYHGLGGEPGVEGTKPRAVAADTRRSSSGVSSQYAAAPARSSDDGDDFVDDDDDGFSTSSCDEDDEDDSSTPQCECLFQGVAEKLATMDEDEPRRLCRGRIGPGAWHCYTAVFDGSDSLLRVDGASEPVSFGMVPEDTTYLPQPSASASFSSDNTPQQQQAARARLDGLTIGSDHSFGMSLCCGNGSGGEGEGAIAELAVFSGRLALLDLQVLEHQMMLKHGITAWGTTTSARDPQQPSFLSSLDNGGMKWKENDWTRRAHALFFLPQISRPDNNGSNQISNAQDGGGSGETTSGRPEQVPLRFLSQHRAVAWKQKNPGETRGAPRNDSSSFHLDG